VYHLLSLLESDAAGVVATKATDAELAELQKLHKELEAAAKPGKAAGTRAGDTARANTDLFFALNEQFHMRLLEIANNRWRDQMVADLRKVMKLNRHNSLLKTGRIAESLAEHQAIMAALLARDAVRTQESMREHFANGLEAAE
jgi:DNA-binding GntR family transcriptional regulator